MPSPSGKLIFTTVPSGVDVDKKQPVITLHVAPQLVSTNELAAMRDWTSNVQTGKIQFQLVNDAGTSVAITPTLKRLRPELWKTFFEDATPLNAFGASGALGANGISDAKVNLNYILNAAKTLHREYVSKADPTSSAGIASLKKNAVDTASAHALFGFNTARIAKNPPNTMTLKDFLSDPNHDPHKNLTVTRIFGSVNLGTAFPDPSKVLIKGDAITEMDNIHNGTVHLHGASHIIHSVNRLRSASRRTPSNISPTSFSAAIQSRGNGSNLMPFHQRLSVLLNMPLLLEILGLVLEFFITPEQVGPSTKLSVQLVSGTTYPGSGITIDSPYTFLDRANFLPLPTPVATAAKKNPIIATSGFIDTSKDYLVDSLQPEAAGLQTFNFSNQAAIRLNTAKSDAAAVSRKLDEDYNHAILPHSPHTDGLYVYQHDRQTKVQDKLGLQLNPDTDGFYAEDLFHSYAVDLLPTGGKWTNLTQRNETYYLGRKPLPQYVIAEANNREHGVRTSAIRPTDAVSSGDSQNHVIDETLFTWRHGSLALSEPAGPKGSMKSQNPERLSMQSIPWISDFIGSFQLPADVQIPSQRFGQEYSFSLRPIYITGRARPFDKDLANKAAIPNPAKLLRNEMVLGPHLIKRAGAGHATADTQSLMFVASRIENPQGGSTKPKSMKASPVIKSAIRFLVPSATTPAVARRHGMADVDIQKGATVLPLSNGALPDSLPSVAKPNPPGVSLANAAPYIPDPMCDGVRARLLFIGNASMPTTKLTKPIVLKYYSKKVRWPNYVLHYVELEPGKVGELPKLQKKADHSQAGIHGITRRSQKIVCTLPPGMTAVLELTPTILDSERGVHAFAPTDGTALEDTNICRPTILRMTHATDLPVSVPQCRLETDNNKDLIPVFDRKTIPAPQITTYYEPYSTAKVSIEATWAEMTDDPASPAPKSQLTKARFCDRSLPKIQPGTTPTNIDGSSSIDVSPPTKLPFADTRYRRLDMVISGTTRFADIFDLSSKPIPTTTSFRTYDLLSIAPPAVPDIEYVMPTFEWDTATKGKHIRAVGLAIVLNRPWFATGAGEKLAVLLSQGSTVLSRLIPSQYADLPGAPAGTKSGAEDQVTAWGTHAIWKSVEASTMAIELKNGDGPLFVTDTKNPSKTVVTFDPIFNQAENRWYCNLSFSEPPVYGALVRLAVARYQPNSIKDCSISETVITDFAFLGPSRTLAIKRSLGKSEVEVTITGVGAYDADGKLLTRFQVRLAHEADRDFTRFNWREPEETDDLSDKSGKAPILWHGFVPIENTLATNALVVREFELYPSFYEYSSGGSETKSERKLVYADVIDVPLL